MTARRPGRPPPRPAAPRPASGGRRAGHAGQESPAGIPAGQSTRPTAGGGRERPQAAPGLIRDDVRAGTVFRHDHGIRHPHDLGNRACFALIPPKCPPRHQPAIAPLCRGPGTAPTTRKDKPQGRWKPAHPARQSGSQAPPAREINLSRIPQPGRSRTRKIGARKEYGRSASVSVLRTRRARLLRLLLRQSAPACHERTSASVFSRPASS